MQIHLEVIKIFKCIAKQIRERELHLGIIMIPKNVPEAKPLHLYTLHMQYHRCETPMTIHKVSRAHRLEELLMRNTMDF